MFEDYPFENITTHPMANRLTKNRIGNANIMTRITSCPWNENDVTAW